MAMYCIFLAISHGVLHESSDLYKSAELISLFNIYLPLYESDPAFPSAM